MAQVIPFERYIRREEATEASTALEIEKIPKSITDEVFKKLGSVIGQTVISEQLAPKRAVQPVQPESLYTGDRYLVKIIEILDQCLRQLELALEEYDDEIAREDTMLLFVHYLHKVSHLAMRFEVNQNFEDIITAIQAGIKNKDGKPYTCEEIATLRDVVKTLRQGPIMSDQTYERCLDALDKDFKLGLFEEVDLKI